MLFNFIIVVIGLIAFEVISSVDNAIVNANVLKTMPQRFRKIFLFWGLLFAVFLVRGALPFLIVQFANPDLSIVEVITAAFSSNELVAQSLEASKPLLLLGGGVYLFFFFLGWIFLEKKS